MVVHTSADATADLHTQYASTQVTYVPDRHCFALWRYPLVEGSTEERPQATVPLAVPGADGTLDVTEVPVDIVDASDTAALERALGSRADSDVHTDSARSWLSLARHRDGKLQQGDVDPAAIHDTLASEITAAMPTAAHSVPDATGSRIATAHSLVSVFLQTSAVKKSVADAGMTFTARPYQLRGVSWLSGLPAGGGVLADEMGLGKTLQAVSHMALRARAGEGPFLVVCPTSLLSNWRREIERFAPGVLRPVPYRGPGRTLPAALDPNDVVLTGYSTLRTDHEILARSTWDCVFFDEAHMLKNSRTKLARAARAVPARYRVALTGTPVENHMEELWALLDLTNPELLGTRARFVRRFAQPIEQHGSASALELLTTAIEPVVLRRTKIDVAADLPPKNHIDIVCSVTSEQARLYNAALDEAFDAGFGSGGSRGSRILALLTKLKLICNHPALVDDADRELNGRSGKLDRLTEIIVELAESNSRALIFTQYRKTGEMLAAHLSEATSTAVPFFHGGLDTDSRDRMIQDFRTTSDCPALVLSLRAAGFGLNLTEASTVVHFDRWWNPAVEAQATDRAHRIGQTQPVTVITLTTEGTLEEYISEIHQRKKAISALTESNATSALAALDDVNLRNTLSLREVRA